MPGSQKLGVFLKKLALLIEEEAAGNPDFANKLSSLFSENQATSTLRGATARRPKNYPSPDVLSAMQEKGEGEFRFWLRDFDLATLKSIVKLNGFDVARASQRWTEPDKFIELITTQTLARLRRGSSFLDRRES